MEQTSTKKAKSKERKKLDHRTLMVRIVAGVVAFLMVGATLGSFIYALMMA